MTRIPARREVLKVLHVQRGQRQLGDKAAGRDPRVIDRPGTTALLRSPAQIPHGARGRASCKRQVTRLLIQACHNMLGLAFFVVA
jgi:hypothetical protein